MDAVSINSERDFFSKGLAVGSMNIVTQKALWWFRQEEWETNAVAFWSIMDYYIQKFPAAPIERVRAVGVRTEKWNSLCRA